MTNQTRQSEAERICKLWDDALGSKDLEASLALYADDASTGIVKGKDNLRVFITRVFQTNPPQRKRFKQGFFTDGRIVTWEYPRLAPDGEQMELIEVMEIDQGLIQRHRVYWGWYALSLLKQH